MAIRIVATAGLAVALVAAASRMASEAWFGTWKLRLRTPGERPETLIYSDAGAGAMRMVSVGDQREIVTRLDGRRTADRGANADRAYMLAITAVSPTRYRWMLAIAGTPYVPDINTLAGDRRSFTEVSWLVAKPAKRVTLVYDRQ